jgi:hypothetical protein
MIRIFLGILFLSACVAAMETPDTGGAGALAMFLMGVVLCISGLKKLKWV